MTRKCACDAEAVGGTVEIHIERIARDDQAAEEELEMLAGEGSNSAEAIEADKKYWEEKRQRLTDRHRKTGTR